MEAIAAWHEYSDLTGGTRVAFATTVDGGRSWHRELLELPSGCTTSNDPFTFYDNLTGRMWAGAAASECPGRKIVLALKRPRAASCGRHGRGSGFLVEISRAKLL